MTGLDILRLRLENQLLQYLSARQPQKVVSWLGAVQSQDYAGAKWALGLRIPGSVDSVVEQAFNEGQILRTHVLRPTWHFISAADIHWMLALTSPRVHAASALYYRRLELDNTVFKRSETALSRALKGGRYMTRAQLASVLEKAGISGVSLRFANLMMHAELEGVICSGPRQGRQFTYALLKERAPRAVKLPRERALEELARRYFASHGPATLRDFAWWSGLTLQDVRHGVEMLGSELSYELLDGQTYYWSSSSAQPSVDLARVACLLPNYDEYVIGYTGRDAFFDSSHDHGLIPRNSMLSHHVIMIRGRIAGTWKRTLGSDSVLVELAPFAPFTRSESRLVTSAAQCYADFLGLQLVVK